MKREEIKKLVTADGVDMDQLRDAGRALEPIVGDQVRARAKDELAAEILGAFDKAVETNQRNAATNALAEVFGLATVESREEVEAKQALSAGSQEESKSDEEKPKTKTSSKVDKIVVLRCQPVKLAAYLNDVVINPTDECLAYTHAVVSPMRAINILSTYGRLNQSERLSKTPELGKGDL